MNFDKSYRVKRNFFRELVRKFIYSPYAGSALRRLLESGAEACKTENSYLGGLTQIDVRDAITASSVRSFSKGTRSVLDVGCGGGSLALEMAKNGMTRYVGLDISSVTIERAKDTLRARLTSDEINCSFEVADLRCYAPAAELRGFDLIVFNEVLYYLRVEVALEQVIRYLQWLGPGGLICVSMLGDSKSEAVFRLLQKRLQWLTAFRYQEAHGPGFRFRTGDELPLLMTAILRPLNPLRLSGAPEHG
jgi:SAM-dependent methyltransferase